MPSPTLNPIAWAADATWTSGRPGENTKITPPVGVAEQGIVGNETLKAEYINAKMYNDYQWIDWMRTDQGADQYGDGSDGDVVIGAGTTTLTRDMYYDDLTLGATSILATAGFRVFVRGTLTIASGGYIHANGSDGVAGDGTGNPGGAGAVTGSVLGGTAGGASGNNANGTAGTNATVALGGAGGTGGNGSDGRTGAAGGTATVPVATAGGYRHLFAALGHLHGSAYLQFTGGAGGGGAGGGTSGDGGSGGGGGGVLIVWARIAVIAGTGALRANGGVGGAAYTGPDAAGNGGGGGGGGGVVFFVCRQRSGAGTITADGGAGGALFGTGTVGAAGSAGRTFEMVA